MPGIGAGDLLDAFGAGPIHRGLHDGENRALNRGGNQHLLGAVLRRGGLRDLLLAGHRRPYLLEHRAGKGPTR